MSWLVVNADDGGLATATDDAILRCAEAGLLRNASVVAGGPTAADFVSRARDAGLALPLHRNLTEGDALAGPAPSLTDASGRFAGRKEEVWARADAGELDPAAVAREVRAQWEWLAGRGVSPTHLDGHNHVHVLPDVLAALAPAELEKVWVRAPAAACDPELPEPIVTWARRFAGPGRRVDRFTGYRFARAPSVRNFLRTLGHGDVIEFMVHPGSRAGSGFAASPLRDREAEVLCDPALREELERRGHRLASFREVP